MSESIKFRTQTGEEIELPANPAMLISDLISLVQVTLDDEKYAYINLVYQGQKLDPSNTVKSIGKIDDGDFIIVKIDRSKGKSKVPKASSEEREENKTTTDQDNNTVSSNQDQSSAPSSKPPSNRRPKRGLPLRTEILIPKSDPDDFEQMVSCIMEFEPKFKREDVEKALRVSFYNPDRATAYLFTGNIPNVPEPAVNNPPKKQDEEDTNSIFEKLSNEERELVLIIADDTRKDFATVLQTAVACEFNENDIRMNLAKE